MALTQASEGGLKISNAGTNGQYLQKQSGNDGGLTWASTEELYYSNVKKLETTSAGVTLSGQLIIPSKSSSYEGITLATPNSDGSGEFHIGVHEAGTSNGRSIVFTRGGSDGFDTESMRIDASGSVLIDATSSSDAGGDGNDLVIGSTSDTQKGITIINSTTGKGNIFFSDGAGYKNQCQIKYDHNIDKLTVSTATITALSIDSSQNATFAGNVSDSKGDLRNIPKLDKTSAHTIVASDAGKAIQISTGGVTVNTGVMSGSEAVTIINGSGSDQTITQGSGMTMYNTADASSGNRVLAGRGMATIYYVGGDQCYISGAGLS